MIDLSILDDYNWREVFGAAGEPETELCCQNPITASVFGSPVSVDPFTRADVAEILLASEGEKDERDWMIVGRLKDGRFFAISAGCDYTGWGCRQWGDARVAVSYEELVRWCLTKLERERFGLPLTDAIEEARR